MNHAALSVVLLSVFIGGLDDKRAAVLMGQRQDGEPVWAMGISVFQVGGLPRGEGAIGGFGETTSRKPQQRPPPGRCLLAGRPWLDPVGMPVLWSPVPVLDALEPRVQIS